MFLQEQDEPTTSQTPDASTARHSTFASHPTNYDKVQWEQIYFSYLPKVQWWTRTFLCFIYVLLDIFMSIRVISENRGNKITSPELKYLPGTTLMEFTILLLVLGTFLYLYTFHVYVPHILSLVHQ